MERWGIITTGEGMGVYEKEGEEMTLIRENEVRNWDSDKYGERLVELDRLAIEALQEAANLEGQAKGLRCKANQYQREAYEIVRAITPNLKLELPRG